MQYEKMNIQWFPGHMTKAQRMIEENIKQVDAVCELLDARIPGASRNPDIDAIAASKPRLVILNRADLADPAVTARWKRHFEERGFAVLETDAKSGRGVKGFVPAVRRLLAFSECRNRPVLDLGIILFGERLKKEFAADRLHDYDRYTFQITQHRVRLLLCILRSVSVHRCIWPSEYSAVFRYREAGNISRCCLHVLH